MMNKIEATFILNSLKQKVDIDNRSLTDEDVVNIIMNNYNNNKIYLKNLKHKLNNSKVNRIKRFFLEIRYNIIDVMIILILIDLFDRFINFLLK
ncbi:MAG: hypothetical protein M0R03_21970 [Novosphingobium sp.]|nr:hypothetical protein [Novosphingobium sp.]